MSATTAGAVKAWLETQSLGVAIYRDEAPEGKAPPYIVILEAISIVPEPSVNPANDDAVQELIQVDVIQLRRDPSRQITEDYTLPQAVAAAVHGRPLMTTPTKCYRILLSGMVRLPPDHETQLLQHSITALVKRQLT